MSTTGITARRDFTKIVYPAMLQTYDHRRSDLFCKVEFKDDRLSFTGVIGPKRSGNADGGCGQIDMEFAHRNPVDNDHRYMSPIQPGEMDFTPSWDAELWLDFLDAWNRWHLNDARSYCEHQRELGWREKAREKVTMYHWRINIETLTAVKTAVDAAVAKLKEGETISLPPEIVPLAALPSRLTTHLETPPGPFYVPEAQTTYSRPSEVKSLGWLRPSEHPDGLLCRPCPECGYEYGTKWIKEEAPDEVLDWIRALPESTKVPAWV